MIREFFIRANTFAAPICSDTLEGFATADSASSAIQSFISDCTHPCGVYAAVAYASADAFHEGEEHLSRWLSPEAIKAHKEAAR